MKLNGENLCYGCMSILEENGRCPRCDFDMAEYKMSPHCIRPGNQINRYVIGRVLGEGNWGITYIGKDLLLDRAVAIKEYFPRQYVGRDTRKDNDNTVFVYNGQSDDSYQKELEKFYQEAKKLSKFYDVEGIVSVGDFFYANDTAYLVMAYVEGVTLKEHIKRYGAMDGSDVLRLMKPMMKALQSVHKEGIIHRDISPDNILVNKYGKLVLIDFGSARKKSGTRTQSMTVMFKRGYTPEEQYYNRGKQGTWSDVYSLCATMYFMLTAVPPHEAIDRMLEDRMVSLCDMPEVALSAVEKKAIMRGMAVKVNERTQDMSRLLEEIYGQNPAERSDNKKKKGILWKVLPGVFLFSLVFLWQQDFFAGDKAVSSDTFVSVSKKNGQGSPRPSVSAEPRKAVIRMPNLIGISKKEAIKRISQLGDSQLKVQWREAYSATVKKGDVIKQKIARGVEYERGTVQTQVLTVSRGVRKYKTPDVVGMSAGKARRLLKKRKLKAELHYVEDSRPEGSVLEQSIKPGKRVRAGLKIRLTVSAGEKNTDIKSQEKTTNQHKKPSQNDFVATIPE